jgi:hypothetical protein
MTTGIVEASLEHLDQVAPRFDQYRQFYKQPGDLAAGREFLRQRLQSGESVIFLALDGAGGGQALGFIQLYLDAVIHLQAAAEASAQQGDVDLHLAGVEFDDLRHRIAHRLRHLRRRPEFAGRAAVMRRAVARLHGCVGEERQVIGGFDPPAGRFRNLAHGEKGDAFVAGCFAQGIADGRGVQVAICALIPGDVQNAPPLHRAPDRVGHHSDGGVADLRHLADARDLPGLAIVKAAQLAADYRATGQQRVLHARHPDVDAIGGTAIHLGRRVRAGHSRANQLVVLRALQWRIGRDGKARGLLRQLAIGQAAVRSAVDHRALFGAAGGARHIPLHSSGADQHLARRGAGLAHRSPGGLNAGAAPGGLIAEESAGPGLFDHDLGPVSLELFRQDHGQGRLDALPHLRAGHDYGDLSIGRDSQVGVGGESPRARGSATVRQVEPEDQPGSGGGADDQEPAARDGAHRPAPFAARWMALRIRW